MKKAVFSIVLVCLAIFSVFVIQHRKSRRLTMIQTVLQSNLDTAVEKYQADNAMAILSVLMFIIMPDMASFIFYNFCFTVAVAFVRIIEDINIIKISYLPKIAPRRVEYFAMRELILCFGRFFGYGIMILVGVFGSLLLLKYLLLSLTLFLCIMCISCAHMSQNISNKC